MAILSLSIEKEDLIWFKVALFMTIYQSPAQTFLPLVMAKQSTLVEKV